VTSIRKTLDLRTLKRLEGVATAMDAVRREVVEGALGDADAIVMKETAPGVFEPSPFRERFRKNAGHALAAVFEDLGTAIDKVDAELGLHRKPAKAPPIVPTRRIGSGPAKPTPKRDATRDKKRRR